MIALLFFLGGCSGYRVVGTSLEEVAPPLHREVEVTERVKENDAVRLTMVGGEVVEGRVLLISSEEIVLDPQGESVQPRGYFSSQIESIEVKSDSEISSGTVAVLILGTVAVGGVILYSATASLRNGMFSN